MVLQTKWLKIEKQKALLAALLSIVLFLAYAQYSESIAWILGRAPVLSGILMLLTIRLFFASNITWLTCLGGALCFCTALLTYEQPILLPFALLIILVSCSGLKSKSGWFYIASLFATVLLYIKLRSTFTHEIIGGYEGTNFLTLNVKIIAGNLIRIVGRLFLNPSGNAAFFIGVVIILLLTIALFFVVRIEALNRKAIVFFVAIILVLIAPVLSLGVSIHSFESGRYLYLPSIFLVMALSIGAVHLYSSRPTYRNPITILLLIAILYWTTGKYIASRHYQDASLYARQMEESVNQHFSQSADTLVIDTLKASVHRLPVFRLGFKTGAKWLCPAVDTGKIVIRHVVDEGKR